MGFDPISAFAPLAGGLLDGLFGSNQPQLPPELQWAAGFLKKLAKQRLAYSNSAPMSQPMEQMGLAQAKGLAAQDYQNQRNRLYAGMSNSLNPNGAPGSAPDMLQRLGSNEAAGMSGLDFNAMLQSMADRKNAINDAANYASGVAGASHSYYQPNEPLSGLFGQLASQIGFQHGMQAGPGGTPPIAPMGTLARPAYQDPYQFGQQAGGYGDFNAGQPPIYG